MELYVKFLIINSNKVETRFFDSYYRCVQFVKKCRFSKKIKILSHPLINE